MEHRKAEHSSSKMCRYFRKKMCDFDQDSCWYSHATESSEDLHEDGVSGNDCNQCGKVFKTKSDLMKHILAEHKKRVAKCRNFLQGNCNLDEMSCWFIHDEEIEMAGDKDQMDKNPLMKRSRFSSKPKKKLHQITLPGL
jgi:hypothetical protein